MSAFYAVSGVKNSGKTTLITKLLPVLTGQGLKVATIKHDGHDFQTDVPGTDTFAHFRAGAYGTVVFSDHKYMVVKQQPADTAAEKLTPEQMAVWFPGGGSDFAGRVQGQQLPEAGNHSRRKFIKLRL